ncbi:CPBP family intramembrane glutamic endopeptidase [Hymenobacter weizhouensis]|uniref:CPBP family intramembrane glutamic endopeptidase n=1 Tax=Hymenobacter sp. YIM 151500-1 TaxID=2987689 RepID=UPI002227D6CE|nr:CPBP family intramembrane glutamic endopeptidase [Hymenobacter sp. YIM 151500-1]UYZ64535.1 CPBP family intramembrane metalloprotease [Hymenobacter sp. YIM 151500-1]
MEITASEMPVSAARPEPAYPTIKESWGAFGWFLLIMLVVSLPVFIIFNEVIHRKSVVVSSVATVAGQVATIGFLLWRYRQRQPPLQVLGTVPTSVYAALPAVVLAQVLLRSTIQYLHLPNWMEEAFRHLEAQPVLAFLMVGISAPILEEVLFRGILLTGLLRNYRPWVAIAQSALLFGLFHLNPVQIVSAGLMGLLLGWLYYRTHSLLLCIMVHALNNLLALWVILHPVTKRMDGAHNLFASPWHYAGAVALSALVLAGLLWQVQRATAPPPGPVAAEEA